MQMTTVGALLRQCPLFQVQNVGLHPLQMADVLREEGWLDRVHRNWSRMKRTRRWVIDDLYGAVMKGKR